MTRILMFVALTLFAAFIAAVGFYFVYIETVVLYLPELRSPFSAIPLWKSAVILILIGASGLVPFYAAYKTIQYAASHLKGRSV